MCFGTRTIDRAAAEFGEELAARLCSRAARLADRSGDAAFEGAKAAVLSVTEAGVLDNGLRGSVQKFELADPDDHTRVHHCAPPGPGCAPCAATGCWPCPWQGRMLPAPGQRLVPGWRGRLAAGVPRRLPAERPER